jgi:hypothetical protein
MSVYYYYLRLLLCCCYNRQLYETIKKEDQDENECFLCLREYDENEDIVLLHGKNFPTHNICSECISENNFDKCPICRKKKSFFL